MTQPAVPAVKSLIKRVEKLNYDELNLLEN